MPRRRTVPVEDRRRIIQAYRNGADYVSVARQLGVPRTTAWSVIEKWLRTGEETAGRRGGNRPRSVDDQMLNFYQLLIENDPTITLKRMSAIVRDMWPHKPAVSTATISGALRIFEANAYDLRASKMLKNTNHRSLIVHKCFLPLTKFN